MKRHLLLCFCIGIFLSTPQGAHAGDGLVILREAGVRGSLVRMNHHGDFIEQSPAVRESIHSFALGGFARLELTRWRGISFGVQPELSYTPRGANVELDGAYLGGFRSRYLELALLGRVEAPPVGPAVFYATLGPAPSILLTAKAVGSDGTSSNAKDGTSGVDLGLAAGIGSTLELTARIGLTLEARYVHGFMTTDESGESEIQNRAILLTVGVGALLNPVTNAPILAGGGPPAR